MKPKEPHKDLKDPARQVGNLPGDTAAPDKQKLRDEAEGQKATQFDGNPNVQQTEDRTFGPKDDTPWKLTKKD